MNPLNAALALTFALSIGCGPKQLVIQGDAHLQENRPDAAAQYFQRALDKDPSLIDALRGIAEAHIAREQPVRAIIPAQRALKAGDSASGVVLAKALLLTGRSDDALKTIQKGLEEKPSNPAYGLLHVEALIALGEYEGAALTADEALIDDASIEARTLHTWALLRAGRIDDAIAMASETAAVSPDNGYVQGLCAYVFWIGNRKADFDRTHKMARALLPASPSDYLRHATWLKDQGHPEGAIRHLAAARASYPSNGKVAAQLGLLFAERRAWNPAVRELNSALLLAPYATESTVSGVQRMNTTDSLVDAKRRMEAQEIANRLGDSYQALGKKSQAALSWQTAVQQSIKPTAADFIKVAEAWEKAGNVDAMGLAAQKASDVDPSSAEAHHLLARAFDGSGNTEWAIRHARKSWELNPQKAEVVIFLGTLYESRGEKRIARELYRDALRRHPSDARLYAAFERVGGTRRR